MVWVKKLTISNDLASQLADLPSIVQIPLCRLSPRALNRHHRLLHLPRQQLLIPFRLSGSDMILGQDGVSLEERSRFLPKYSESILIISSRMYILY